MWCQSYDIHIFLNTIPRTGMQSRQNRNVSNRCIRQLNSSCEKKSNFQAAISEPLQTLSTKEDSKMCFHPRAVSSLFPLRNMWKANCPVFEKGRKKKTTSSLSQGSGEQLKCKAFQQFLLLNELAWTLLERRPCVVFTLKDNQKKNATEDFFFFF